MKVTEAEVVFVNVTEDGRPTPIAAKAAFEKT